MGVVNLKLLFCSTKAGKMIANSDDDDPSSADRNN